MKHYSIAIDGPAASGKSTAGKGVSKVLNFTYLDTGSMYRCFTLHMLNKNMDCSSLSDAEEALKDFNMDLKGEKIYLDGTDVSERIREMDVSSNVSEACKHKAVRDKMVKIQQEFSKDHDVVMDGRDISTVVLPDATLKIYQVASVKARATRRYEEMRNKGIEVSYEDIVKDIENRDRIDSTRENSPLTRSEDAILLDTSEMTIDDVINMIVSLFKMKAGENE